MNKISLILFSGAFMLGVNCSEDVRQLKSLLNETVSETGYEKPYNLRIVNANGKDGLETYLIDASSGKSKRVLRGMDFEQEYNAADALVDLYNIFK